MHERKFWSVVVDATAEPATPLCLALLCGVFCPISLDLSANLLWSVTGRGLRPDQTDPFVCQYDLEGNWSLGASDKELADESLKEELKKLMKKNLTQKAMADDLDISVGKVNKLLKEIKEALEKMDEKESATPLRRFN